jgi:site-specific recombinase XerD
MDHIGITYRYRLFLVRINYSKKTIRNYMYNLKNFIEWLGVPFEDVATEVIYEYLGFLNNRRLKPKTINTYLTGLHRFFDYLRYEEKIITENPVKPEYMQLLPKPLPRFITTEEVKLLFSTIKNKRDFAMFILMLRSGLRVEEIANLKLSSIDFSRRMIIVFNGKFRKDRVVYFSKDADGALKDYFRIRRPSRERKFFLVQKGTYKGKAISVRGIQKRIEYYSKKTGLHVSCHCLRHTMATQLINADAGLTTVQELLGHNSILSTQRYAKVSNVKVRRDYFKAINIVLKQEKMCQD